MYSQLQSIVSSVSSSQSYGPQYQAVVIPLTKDSKDLSGFAIGAQTKTALEDVMNCDFFAQDRERASWVKGQGEDQASFFLLLQLGAESEISRDSVRNSFGEACKMASARGFESLAYLLPDNACYAKDFDAGIEGALLASYRFTNYQKEEKLKQSLKKISFYLDAEDQVGSLSERLNEITKTVDCVFVARDWSNQPTNELGPDRYTEEVEALAAKAGLNCTVMHEDELIKRGMNLIMAVGKASVERPRLIHLEYKPKAPAKAKIALVGKGVMYDTGGLSLKPSASMMGMKMDMSGSGCVVSTILAAAALELPVHVHVVTPVVENAVAGNATRPGDVVAAKNGKTVEIENTDAEGRLILADALCYAEDLGVDRIVDVATLTGACLIALGDEIAAVLSSDEETKQMILESSKLRGEKIWPLPLEENYKKLLKSPIADLRNIGGRNAGTITAALFLKEFVEKTKWAHLDIAGPSDTEKELPICPRGGTGFSTMTLVEFLKRC